MEISLRAVGNRIELRVADDGKGFDGMNGMDRINGVSSEPGHLGLASMRERAELLDGELTIDSSDRGTAGAVGASRRLGPARWRL